MHMGKVVHYILEILKKEKLNSLPAFYGITGSDYDIILLHNDVNTSYDCHIGDLDMTLSE